MFGSLKRGEKIAIQYGDHLYSFKISPYNILNPKSFCTQLVFESTEGVPNWLWSTLHGVFDLKLVTKDRLQRYYPCLGRDGKLRGIKEKSGISRLIAVKQAGYKP